MIRLPLDVLAALLPEAQRRSFANRLSLDAVRGTWLLVAFQVLFCFPLWIFGFIAGEQNRLEKMAGEHTRAGTAPSDQEIQQAKGPMGDAKTWSPTALRPLFYVLSPRGLLLEYLFLTGFARLFHVTANAQPLGDPLLALILGGLHGRAARRRQRERLALLGPERPDRVLSDASGLIVVSAREKPDWASGVAVEIDERLFEIRSIADRPDGRWKAVAYRLSPLPEGTLVKRLVPYRMPAAAGPRAAEPARRATVARPPASTPREAAPEEEPEEAAAPERPRPAPPLPAAGGRGRWRVDQGEEARLTPEGPAAAVIESLGSLPLRVRSEAMGVHHRPEFPGSCIRIGGARYEVVAEQPLETGVRYLLEPWAEEFVLREIVDYGPRLVRAAQEERQRAVERERAQRWSTAVAPLVGLLPEEQQRIACDRLGLEATTTTLAGVGLEIGVALALVSSIDAGKATLAMAQAIGTPIVGPALWRLLGLLVAKEVSGNWIVGLVMGAREALGRGALRADATVLPLTRDAFWSRLASPDRHDRQPDGTLVVKSALPHLSWGGNAATRTIGTLPAIAVGRDYWSVVPLPPAVERGRLVHAYHLWPLREEGMLKDLPEPPPPDPRLYGKEVLAEVKREWDDIFGVAPWLPCLLPRAAQERAYRGRGGPEGARFWALATVGVTLLLAAWFLAGSGGFNKLTGLILLADAAFRAWRALGGEHAPSLLGLPISDLLRPEREAYHAHLDAERAALLALRRRA